MKTYQELEEPLLKAQGCTGKKVKKEYVNRVKKCAETEFAIQKEIEDSIKNEASLQREINQKRQQLNQLVTQKYEVIYAKEIEEIQKSKDVAEIAKEMYNCMLQRKKKVDKNIMIWNQRIHVKDMDVFYTDANDVGKSMKLNNVKVWSTDAYNVELAIAQLINKFIQMDKINVEASLYKRTVTCAVTSMGDSRTVDMQHDTEIIYSEKIVEGAKQQANGPLSADEFAQKVLNSKNSEVIAEWLIKHVEECLTKIDKDPSNKFFELPFEVTVYPKMVTFEKRLGRAEREERFEFETNNMQTLSNENMCVGLAKALVTLVKLGLKENHELSEIKEMQWDNRVKLIFREINPEYTGMRGWED